MKHRVQRRLILGCQPLAVGFGLGLLVLTASGFSDTSIGVAAAQIASPTDARQQARQLIREAGQLMDQGDKAGAAEKLTLAQQLYPDPTLDYNLAVVYAEMGKHPEAAKALSKFVSTADPGAVLADRLEDARKRLRGYQTSLARLRLQLVQPVGGSEPKLTIDQADYGTVASGAAQPTYWLTPGTHRIQASAAGSRDFLVQVDLNPGELRQLTGELLPSTPGLSLVPSTPALRHAEAEANRPIYKKWWFWTAIGGGAVLVGLVATGASGGFTRTAPGSDLDPVDVSR